jgi:arylsulfatase A-like enzyme
VPNIFGMNFQAVSVGQKLIEKSVGQTGGYMDGEGRPNPALLKEIQFVDEAIGKMVDLLEDRGLLRSTLIVISAKHGQSPIDPNRFFPIPGHSGANGQPPSSIVASLLPDSEVNQIGSTEDDISLLWLTDSDQTSNAVSLLEKNATQAGIGEIFFGSGISQLFNPPGLPPDGDPRTPDIIIIPNIGVVYTGSTKKLAEHGGFAHDDINVMLLLSNPRFRHKTVTSPVETTQVAPTILKAPRLLPPY